MTLFALPLLYLGWIVAKLVRRRTDGLGISMLCFGVTVAAGAWAILQSRASTAAIGLLFLPGLASVSGLLGLAYGASRRSSQVAVRALGVVAMVSAGLPAALELRSGITTIAKNERRDVDQLRRDSAYARHRIRLDTLLLASGDRATDTLEALLRAHRNDRELVLAGLERPQIRPALLDTFTRSPDLGIALQAIRNPNTPSETLERIYRVHRNRDYFLQALASHANTPPAVLREIHELRPAPIMGLDIAFAGNSSTPTDVLLDIARTSESIHAMRALLRHPALVCGMIEAVAHGPAAREHPDDADVAARLAVERTSRCR